MWDRRIVRSYDPSPDFNNDGASSSTPREEGKMRFHVITIFPLLLNYFELFDVALADMSLGLNGLGFPFLGLGLG